MAKAIVVVAIIMVVVSLLVYLDIYYVYRLGRFQYYLIAALIELLMIGCVILGRHFHFEGRGIK